MAGQPLSGQGHLFVEASRTQSDALRSVGLLFTSDQPVADTSTRHHTTINRQTSMPPAGFQPTAPANERPQTPVLDLAAAGIGISFCERNHLH
jgi:dethiobiotin synthetase